MGVADWVSLVSLAVRKGCVNEDGTHVEDFQLTDSSRYGIPIGQSGGRLLGFFFDDESTSSEATAGGKIYALQIWASTIFSDGFESEFL